MSSEVLSEIAVRTGDVQGASVCVNAPLRWVEAHPVPPKEPGRPTGLDPAGREEGVIDWRHTVPEVPAEVVACRVVAIGRVAALDSSS